MAACGPPVPEPSESSSPTVRFEPAMDDGAVSSVSHIHVSAANAAQFFLFQGTLSSYYLGKLKDPPLPDALLARQLPLASIRAADEWLVAPLQALSSGQYSLASDVGLIAEFAVNASLPLLSRVWPPPDASASPRFAVYCSESVVSAALPSGESLTLGPRALSVQLIPGVDAAGTFADRCLHFACDAQLEADETLLAPPVVGAWALRPALFSESTPQATDILDCLPDEIAFGAGCATAADDRVEVRAPESSLLWVVHTDHGSLLQVTQASRPLVVKGLSPGTSEHVWGSARDASGAERDFDLSVRMAPARARPILNEALADALGPEPQSEWVELFNDGTLAVDLAQYSLQDGGGRTALPHVSLPAKAFALLVRDDYAPNDSDAPPAPGALLVRVPMLGKSGLSNSGERLSLVDSDGQELSVLPALSGKPGLSLARRTPASPDTDPSSFSFGAPTPGAPNSAATISE